MAEKPITILRHEYMQDLCRITNESELPAFVKLEVIERLKSQLENLAQAELERDFTLYRQDVAKEKTVDQKEDNREKEDSGAH